MERSLVFVNQTAAMRNGLLVRPKTLGALSCRGVSLEKSSTFASNSESVTSEGYLEYLLHRLADKILNPPFAETFNG